MFTHFLPGGFLFSGGIQRGKSEVLGAFTYSNSTNGGTITSRHYIKLTTRLHSFISGKAGYFYNRDGLGMRPSVLFACHISVGLKEFLTRHWYAYQQIGLGRTWFYRPDGSLVFPPYPSYSTKMIQWGTGLEFSIGAKTPDKFSAESPDSIRHRVSLGLYYSPYGLDFRQQGGDEFSALLGLKASKRLQIFGGIVCGSHRIGEWLGDTLSFGLRATGGTAGMRYFPQGTGRVQFYLELGLGLLSGELNQQPAFVVRPHLAGIFRGHIAGPVYIDAGFQYNAIIVQGSRTLGDAVQFKAGLQFDLPVLIKQKASL